MNISILGNICIDKNFTEKTSYLSVGSPCFFITKIFQKKFNLSTTIISSYGKDFNRLINQHNLTLYPEKPTNKLTLIYHNKIINKKRYQKVFNQKTAQILIPLNLALKKNLKKTDIFFFAPLTPFYKKNYIKAVLSNIKKNALKIFLPQGYFRKFIRHKVKERNFYEKGLLSFFDFVIVSHQDHKNMLSLAKRWAKRTQIIVTLAEKGVIYFYKNISIYESVKAVKPEDIIDSIGAGDIFAAAFAYQFYQNKDIKSSLKFANKIARESLFYPSKDL